VSSSITATAITTKAKEKLTISAINVAVVNDITIPRKTKKVTRFAIVETNSSVTNKGVAFGKTKLMVDLKLQLEDIKQFDVSKTEAPSLIEYTKLFIT
jgi:sporulation protein YlmC with PRC-barrel domain